MPIPAGMCSTTAKCVIVVVLLKRKVVRPAGAESGAWRCDRPRRSRKRTDPRRWRPQPKQRIRIDPRHRHRRRERGARRRRAEARSGVHGRTPEGDVRSTLSPVGRPSGVSTGRARTPEAGEAIPGARDRFPAWSILPASGGASECSPSPSACAGTGCASRAWAAPRRARNSTTPAFEEQEREARDRNANRTGELEDTVGRGVAGSKVLRRVGRRWRKKEGKGAGGRGWPGWVSRLAGWAGMRARYRSSKPGGRNWSKVNGGSGSASAGSRGGGLVDLQEVTLRRSARGSGGRGWAIGGTVGVECPGGASPLEACR